MKLKYRVCIYIVCRRIGRNRWGRGRIAAPACETAAAVVQTTRAVYTNAGEVPEIAPAWCSLPVLCTNFAGAFFCHLSMGLYVQITFSWGKDRSSGLGPLEWSPSFSYSILLVSSPFQSILLRLDQSPVKKPKGTKKVNRLQEWRQNTLKYSKSTVKKTRWDGTKPTHQFLYVSSHVRKSFVVFVYLISSVHLFFLTMDSLIVLFSFKVVS